MIFSKKIKYEDYQNDVRKVKSSFFVCTLVALSDYKNEKGRSKYLYDLVKTISIQLFEKDFTTVLFASN